MQEQHEEKTFGKLTPEQADELYSLLETGEDTAARIRRFMKKHHLPFMATDRSVLNLPAIGKSMTFNLVGITEEGKRILRFDHDSTRRHSSIIDKLGKIYIVENKSLAAYLRQLSKMGKIRKTMPASGAIRKEKQSPASNYMNIRNLNSTQQTG